MYWLALVHISVLCLRKEIFVLAFILVSLTPLPERNSMREKILFWLMVFRLCLDRTP